MLCGSVLRFFFRLLQFLPEGRLIQNGNARACAFVSLLPAASPARTNVVFLLTEEDALPPFCRISSSASSREREGNVPVTTTVMPVSGPSEGPAAAWGCTPAARSLSIISLFSAKEKNSVILWATISPTSWMAVNSSSVACSTFSRVPNACARSRAVFRPTLGIPRANRKASKGQLLLFPRLQADFLPSFP